MLIHCKGCGKAYRVDEKRLTPEGIRVRCRHCGSVLMIRLRKEHEMQAVKEEEPAAAVPPEPRIKAEAPEAVSAEPSGMAAEAALTGPEFQKEFEPEPPSESVSAPEAPSPKYRFCIYCGGPLVRDLPACGRPVCGNCESGRSAAVSEPEDAVSKAAPGMSVWKKILLLIVLLFVILFAAFMGYQTALGKSFMSVSVSNVFYNGMPAPQIPPLSSSGAAGF